MKVNFNVKYKFKVNGKEYGSLEEIPAPIREAYEKAVDNTAGLERENIQSISSAKVVFNGQEYESVDSMPDEIRRIYETIMKTVKSGEISQAENAGVKTSGTKAGFRDEGGIISPDVSRPISPESFFSPRVLIIAAGIIVLLAGIYFLFSIGGSR